MNWIYKISALLVVLVGMNACKNSDKQDSKMIEKDSVNQINSSTRDSIIYDNGIKIHWIKRGSGEKLTQGDMVEIDYKVFLEDGKIIEGSHMFEGTFPFMVGFQMQTPGWDFIMNQLKVGDKIEAFIPAKLARGEKGIKGLIPPNANNIVLIEVIEKRKPDELIDGVRIYSIASSGKNKLKFNKDNTILFHAMASTPTLPLYLNTFASNEPFSYQAKNAGLVPGLSKALKGKRKADRLYVVIPPEEAYAEKGYLNLVKPNEPIFYNIYVMDVY